MSKNWGGKLSDKNDPYETIHKKRILARISQNRSLSGGFGEVMNTSRIFSGTKKKGTVSVLGNVCNSCR